MNFMKFILAPGSYNLQIVWIYCRRRCHPKLVPEEGWHSRNAGSGPRVVALHPLFETERTRLGASLVDFGWSMQMSMGGLVAPGMMPAMMPGVGMNGRPDFLGALQPHQPPLQSQRVVSLPLGMQQPPAAQQSQPWHAPSMSMPSGLLPGSSAGLASLAASANPATANGHFSMPLQQGVPAAYTAFFQLLSMPTFQLSPFLRDILSHI